MSKVWLARFLIGLGSIIVLITLGFIFYQQGAERIYPVPMPNSLGDLSLSSRTLGRSALNELSWLHGQEFQLNKGAVGTFGEGGEITLYVAGTPFRFMAGRMLVAMRDKIAQSDMPFTPIAEREIEKRVVYELQGMGQRHFYFRSNDLIIWLAADETQAEEALKQVLEFYP
jgi:hypothetical protein